MLSTTPDPVKIRIISGKQSATLIGHLIKSHLPSALGQMLDNTIDTLQIADNLPAGRKKHTFINPSDHTCDIALSRPSRIT